MTGMFRSFRARIFWAILLVAAVAAGLSLWLTREWLEERQLDEARTGLLREARVAGGTSAGGGKQPEGRATPCAPAAPCTRILPTRPATCLTDASCVWPCRWTA